MKTQPLMNITWIHLSYRCSKASGHGGSGHIKHMHTFYTAASGSWDGQINTATIRGVVGGGGEVLTFTSTRHFMNYTARLASATVIHRDLWHIVWHICLRPHIMTRSCLCHTGIPATFHHTFPYLNNIVIAYLKSVCPVSR